MRRRRGAPSLVQPSPEFNVSNDWVSGGAAMYMLPAVSVALVLRPSLQASRPVQTRMEQERCKRAAVAGIGVVKLGDGVRGIC